ncbi:hypothetical protein STEG23_032704, partial [Scotinomys teguina]
PQFLSPGNLLQVIADEWTPFCRDTVSQLKSGFYHQLSLSPNTNAGKLVQNRYFVLDFEAGLLQYFVNEQSRQQKPRGVLSLSGAIVSLSDEAPHMLVVYSANGEMYKLRAADAKERQFWVTQLRACAKYHMENSSKVDIHSVILLSGLNTLLTTQPGYQEPHFGRLQVPEAEVSLCSPMEHPILRLPVARDTSVPGPPELSQSRITSRLQLPEESRVSIPANFTK